MTGSRRAARWAGPVLLVLGGLVLAAISWQRWPDVLLDFGREAYTAWRLAEGDVLYRDIASFNGPLSSYWNALWMAAFGPSLTVLFVVNVGLLAAFTALAYRIVVDLSDRLTATVACLVVLALLALAQLRPVGSYNFVAPYAHEATHGLLCGLAAVACVCRWASRPDWRWLLAAGTFSGLAMLTKTEMALAGVFAPLAGLCLAHRFVEHARPQRAILIFAGGATAVLGSAFLSLLLRSGYDAAWTGILAPWQGLFAREVMALPYYRIGMGTDDLPANLLTMGAWTLGWALVLAPAIAVALLPRSAPRWSRPATWALPLLYAAVLVPILYRADWHLSDIGSPLPVVALAVAIGAVIRRARGAVALAALIVALYAIAVLGKMLFHPRLHHYGFVLAIPATLLAVVALLHWIPACVEHAGGRAGVVRAAAMGLLLVPCALYAGISVRYWQLRTVPVGTGGDTFLADRRGVLVGQALETLARTPPDSTLAALPEGAMLNYLARRRNPTGYIVFMPPELLLFGEAAMLAAFEAHPPDRIALVHKDTREYGVGAFGLDYGRALMSWVSANYRLEHALGDAPFEPGATFGISILVRR